MSVLARILEEHKIATTSIVMVREHAARVKPPRALFVPFYFGFALGRPDDPAYQHRVIRAAFDLLAAPAGPVLTDFPEDGDPSIMPQASEVTAAPFQVSRNTADEVTALRAFYERWVVSHGGRTAVGLSGIPQRRFRGMVPFLEAVARGEDADFPERPAEVSRPQFIRYCADDLKAFYYEARMAQQPTADAEALHRWFWGSTAAGKLIADLAAQLNAAEDPTLRAIAYGLAR